jgi:hypothetical protein
MRNIKNFWNYLTKFERILFVFAIACAFIFLFVSGQLYYFTTSNTIELHERLNVIVTLTGMLSFPILLIFVVNFINNTNKLKLRHRYLFYMYNIYDRIKDKISKIHSETVFMEHIIKINDVDAMEIKESFISMKDLGNKLHANDTMGSDEIECINYLMARIDSYLNNNTHVSNMIDGVLHAVKPIEINSKWLTDIPFLMEKNRKVNGFSNTTIEEMLNKFQYKI